ncbi:MAG: ATP phosphoribosyltransferase [Anaerolineaceae bacterium]|nr:ATP phosphoribosyltransferase [Anaerolineaceae bacterium]
MAGKLKLGIPKGSLQESTFDMMRRAGFDIHSSSRSLRPTVDDPELEIIQFRAQEMSRYVEDGVVDAGLTGKDWILENGSDVVDVADFVYAKAKLVPVRWVLAVPQESKIQKAEDLEGGIIATELVKTTRKYFADRGIKVKVEFSWGATEAKARLLDGIVEVTETGSSLRANGLRIVETLLESTTHFIANKASWDDPWMREKIENLTLLLRGAMSAREKVGLKMNVPRDKLEKVTGLLPAEKSPTVSNLLNSDWVAIEVILPEVQERLLVPQLKRAGATGIIVYPLNKVIP